jgi:hypothetical protein
METIIIALAYLTFYAVMDGLGDAFIFRDIRLTPDGLKDSENSLSFFRAAARAFAAHDFNTNWHRAQAIQQAGVIIVTALLSGYWQVIPLGAGLFWLIHDGIVNRIGLERPFFFVGTTAWIDRQFQKTGHPELFMAACKIGLILAGGASFLIK